MQEVRSESQIRSRVYQQVILNHMQFGLLIITYFIGEGKPMIFISVVYTNALQACGPNPL